MSCHLSWAKPGRLPGREAGKRWCLSFIVQFNSVAQSCPTLCDPMNRSTPGLPVHHQLPESTQTHVHQVGDAIQPSHPLSSPSPPALYLSHYQGLFKWVSSSHQVAKYWRFSFNISPSNEHAGLISFRMDWFDLLAVQGSLRVSPTPQFESIISSVLSLLYGPALTSRYDYWKNYYFGYTELCQQNDVSVFFNILISSIRRYIRWHEIFAFYSISSVIQSRLTLWDPMNRSMPGLSVHHLLPESTQTHVHQVGNAIQPSHPLSSPSPPTLNLSQHQGLFQWVSSLHQVAKILEFQLQHQSFQWTPRTDLF